MQIYKGLAKLSLHNAPQRLHKRLKFVNFASMAASERNRIITGSDFLALNKPDHKGYILHLICESGSAEFIVGNREFCLQPYSLMAFPNAGAIKNIHCDKDFKCLFVLVSDKFLHSLLPARNYSISGHLKLFSTPVITVTQNQATVFKEDILAIEKRVGDTGHKFYDEMIGGLLRTLAYDFFEFHSEFAESIPDLDRANEISRQFFLLLESGRVKYEREPGQYASALHVSRKYLNTVIKRLTGNNVSYHIDRTTSAMIIDYLNENKLSVSQIADEMNFTSLGYFSRYCKKHLNMSPTRYRLTKR